MAVWPRAAMQCKILASAPRSGPIRAWQATTGRSCSGADQGAWHDRPPYQRFRLAISKRNAGPYTASIFGMNPGKALSAGLDALRGTLPRFISLARELALEVVGFMFLAFAAFFVFGPFGLIQAYRRLPESMDRLVVAIVVAIVFVWFGFDSFRRAKKLARKR